MHPLNANPTAIRHPERSEVLLRERKRADAKPVPRAGIYKGVFVTFHRRSYFPYKPAGSSPRPTLRATAQPLPPSVEGGGEPASRRESFKSKVTFPRTRTHTVRPYEFVQKRTNSSLPCVKGGVKILNFDGGIVSKAK